MSDDSKKILLKLEEMEDLLKEVLSLLKKGGSGPAAPAVEPRKPSDVKLEEGLKKDVLPEGGRRVCPKCGSLNFTEQVDKENVLLYQGGQPIYAKKYVCNKCGTIVA